MCPDTLRGGEAEGGLKGEDDDKKRVLTGVETQTLLFQLYKSHFTCLWTIGYSMDKLQEADIGEQPEL